MNFFDSLIDDFLSACKPFEQKPFPFSENKLWADAGVSHIVLQRNTACELDGTGINLVTCRTVEDGVVVIGNDISEIRGKKSFARVSLIQLEEEDDDDAQKLYNLIRNVEYVKYHFFPEGYMLRSSSRAYKEAARVSDKATGGGISFEKLGNLLIKKYRENPRVKGVKVFFITDDSFNFSFVESLALKNNSITETLNHVINNVKFDCDTCNLKAVCDEVEGMKELHFKSMKRGM